MIDSYIKRELIPCIVKLRESGEWRFAFVEAGYVVGYSVSFTIEQINKLFTEDIENGYVVGYTENYLKVSLPINTPLNCLIKVKLMGYNNHMIISEVL